MADGTKIEWTDATWNPITGCKVVSPGCTNCYAMKLAGTRLKHIPSREGLTIDTKAGPVWNGQVRFNDEWLTQPLTWKRPRMIFVVAHGDLFSENVPDEWIDKIFAVMALAPQHIFQVLTKRPQRMRAYLNDDDAMQQLAWTTLEMAQTIPSTSTAHLVIPNREDDDPHFSPWPLSNVWLGTSVEDQVRANERIPLLLDTPAAVRWISAEPLLGPIDLKRSFKFEQGEIKTTYSGLNWVVAGGESGPNARPMQADWVRQIRDQCGKAGIPFLFKQWGNWLGGHWEDLGDQGIFVAADRPGHSFPFRPKAENQHWFEPDNWPEGPGALRLPKAVAGRMLDGRHHEQFPEIERTAR